jgi:hypothetical protein
MTFKEFYEKYKGMYLDFDGYYGPQCVDLVQYWSRELGGARFSGNAKDIIDQPGRTYQVILNARTNIPSEGDIVVWNKNMGVGNGHTGIATGKGDINTFEVFQQNDPYATPAKLKTYNYNNVIGWLHPRAITTKSEVDYKILYETLVTGVREQIKATEQLVINLGE